MPDSPSPIEVRPSSQPVAVFEVVWRGQTHLVLTAFRGPPSNDWCCVAKDQNLNQKARDQRSAVCFAPTPIQAIEGAYAQLDKELQHKPT